MGTKRKISGEANGPIVVVLPTMTVSRTEPFQRGMMEGVGLRLKARRALLQQMIPQYRAASPSQKRELLDAFIHVMGYYRKYAMWLFNHTEEGHLAPVSPHPTGCATR